MRPEFQPYIENVRRHLHLSSGDEGDILRELETHLEDRLAEYVEQGLPYKKATQRVIGTFGRPRAVAQELYEAYSLGTWGEARLAALPILLVAGLFAAHLALNYFLLAGALGLVIFVSLYEWWLGKPAWMYSWVGCALVPVVVASYLAILVLKREMGVFMGGEATASTLGYLALGLAFFPLTAFILISTTVSVVRRDWVLATLMLTPLPVFAAWLSAVSGDGFLGIDSAKVRHYDQPMAWVLVAVAFTAAAFIRLRQRAWKVAMVVGPALVVLTAVSYKYQENMSFLGLVGRALLLLAFLLSPAFLESPRETAQGVRRQSIAWLRHLPGGRH